MSEVATKQKEPFVKMKNPYTFGVPVRGENFFGREEELGIIFNTLENVQRGQKQDLAVTGTRRIGKSSLLYRLLDLLTDHEEFVPVYVDVQNIKPRKVRILFYKILTQIKKSYKQKKSPVQLPPFKTLESDHTPTDLEFLIFDEDLTGLDNLIASQDLPRLVLMFDEADLLVELGGQDTLAWFRSLIQSLSHSIFVVAGSERLYSLTQDYGSPFYNIFKTVELRPLTYEAAKKLLEIPAAKIGMDILPAEVDKILQSAGNNPYLIQGIAHYLVERLNSQKRRQVYPADVDDVIKESVKHLSPQFNYIWNGTSELQKIILHALAQSGYPQSPDSLVSNINKLSNKIEKSDQKHIFEDLVQKGILVKKSKQSYWFIGHLFIDWILSEIDDEETIGSNRVDLSQNANNILNKEKIELLAPLIFHIFSIVFGFGDIAYNLYEIALDSNSEKK